MSTDTGTLVQPHLTFWSNWWTSDNTVLTACYRAVTGRDRKSVRQTQCQAFSMSGIHNVRHHTQCVKHTQCVCVLLMASLKIQWQSQVHFTS